MDENLYKDIIKIMSGEELDKIQEDDDEKGKYLLLDVRSEEEYDEGHVKHAVNFPFHMITTRVSEIENYKDKPVITICNIGGKSGKSAKMLANLGFKNIYDASGVKKYAYTNITKVHTIFGQKFKELVESGDYTVLDARKSEDYKAGHMKGAINVEPDELDSMLGKIPRDKVCLTYCYSGNRGWRLADKLNKAGYIVINAFNGLDGYDGYEFVK